MYKDIRFAPKTKQEEWKKIVDEDAKLKVINAYYDKEGFPSYSGSIFFETPVKEILDKVIEAFPVTEASFLDDNKIVILAAGFKLKDLSEFNGQLQTNMTVDHLWYFLPPQNPREEINLINFFLRLGLYQLNQEIRYARTTNYKDNPDFQLADDHGR